MAAKSMFLLFLIVGYVSTGSAQLREERLQNKQSLTNEKANDFPCPVSADIIPCECYTDSDGEIIVDCSLAESDEQMEGVFQEYWPVKDLFRFDIYDNPNLTHFDYDLNGLTFKMVKFNRVSNMKTISEDFFSDSVETLSSLIILDSKLKTFPLGNITEFSNLTSINILGSKLEEIPFIISDTLVDFALSQSLLTEILPGEEVIDQDLYRIIF